MTVALMEDWERCSEALHNPTSMLVRVAFHGHVSEELKVKTQEEKLTFL
jgi:hypothetical protein